jgi:Profilin
MSWQAYVDDQLVGTGHVTAAVIIGHDGSVWAHKNLNLAAGEGVKVVAGFKDSAAVLGSGVVIGGVKYLSIKADDKSIYGTHIIIFPSHTSHSHNECVIYITLNYYFSSPPFVHKSAWYIHNNYYHYYFFPHHLSLTTSVNPDPLFAIIGKKGAGGVVCVKTNQAVLIGQYNETVQPGQATTVVEKLADYLRDNGF